MLFTPYPDKVRGRHLRISSCENERSSLCVLPSAGAGEKRQAGNDAAMSGAMWEHSFGMPASTRQSHALREAERFGEAAGCTL